MSKPWNFKRGHMDSLLICRERDTKKVERSIIREYRELNKFTPFARQF